MVRRHLEITPVLETDQASAFPGTSRLALLPGHPPCPNPAIVPSMRFEDFRYYAEDWVEEARARPQSPDTIYGKADTVKKFLEFLERDPDRPLEVTPREFRRFINHVAVGHQSPGGRFGNPKLTERPSERTIEYYYNYLRGMVSWMMRAPSVPLNADLMAGVRVAKPVKKVVQPFSVEDLNALFAAARRTGNPTRDVAILEFSLDTGARAMEVCGLRKEFLMAKAAGGHVKVLGKGRKERILPFSRQVSRALWAYNRTLSDSVKSDYVFRAYQGGFDIGKPLTENGLLQLYERLGRDAGITGVRCSPHTMRHTFAINFLRNGANIFALQAMLGHTSLTQVRDYLAIVDADINSQQAKYSVADSMNLHRR